MITHNRIKLSEKQVALIWKQLVGKGRISTEGKLVNVIYPGRTNGNSGPDFQDAVIAIKSRLVKGDVEVHVESSDWYRHRHHDDAAYNNVILHVVMWHDCDSTTLLQNGNEVPMICLAMTLRQQAYLLPYRLPCSRITDRLNRHTVTKVLNNAGEQRFKQKAMHFRTELKEKEVGQVLFRGIMRALGYAKNTRPFENLAGRLPLNYIECSKGVALKQALLLGTAGLLPSQRWQGRFAGEKEVQELEQLWQSTNKEIETMKQSDWSFSHIYPNNSPVRRIIALSHLLERYSEKKLLTSMLQLVKEASRFGGHRVLERGLSVACDGYWLDHFDFNVTSKTRRSAILGNSKVSEIIVNVVLPFAYAWGELTVDPQTTENAVELYCNYPKLSENCLTYHMKEQLGLGESFDLTACRKQGLIHIFKNYCCEGRCGQCPLVGWIGPRDSDKLS
ncbi:MAG: DUF2851 family protein [Dehalococcoidia bacterium]|jgi:hypothetical protein